MDHQNWQEAVALSIVALTAGLLLWKKFRRRSFDFRRDTGCGCCASAGGHADRKGSIVLEGRRGEPQKITVKLE